MKAFIFGAGASKGYKGSKTKLSPPLANEFFRTFNELEISGDIDVRIGEIVNYIRDTRNISYEEIIFWNEDIESFLTEIEDKLNRLEGDFDNVDFLFLQRTYDRMIFLFSAVLNEIQNGDTCVNYSKIVATANDNDVFITFNWDTLLDRALFESNKWHFEDGYGIRFNSIFDDGWIKLNNSNKSKVKLLKLHGSTNWLIPYYSYRYDMRKWMFLNEKAYSMKNPLFLFYKATQKYVTYADRSRCGYEPFSYFYYPPDILIPKRPIKKGYATISTNFYPDTKNYGITEGDKLSKISMPLIIPPVKHKKYDFAGGKLNKLWKDANVAISKATDIIICGYSFPETDTKAWEIMDGINKNNKLNSIKIIDPYPYTLKDRIINRYPFLEEKMEVFEMTLEKYLDDYSL